MGKNHSVFDVPKPVIQLPAEYSPAERQYDYDIDQFVRSAASIATKDDAHPLSRLTPPVEIPGDPVYDLEYFAQRMVQSVFVSQDYEEPREASKLEVVDGKLVDTDESFSDLNIPRPHESSERHMKLTPERLSEQ